LLVKTRVQFGPPSSTLDRLQVSGKDSGRERSHTNENQLVCENGGVMHECDEHLGNVFGGRSEPKITRVLHEPLRLLTLWRRRAGVSSKRDSEPDRFSSKGPVHPSARLEDIRRAFSFSDVEEGVADRWLNTRATASSAPPPAADKAAQSAMNEVSSLARCPDEAPALRVRSDEDHCPQGRLRANIVCALLALAELPWSRHKSASAAPISPHQGGNIHLGAPSISPTS